MKLCEVLCNLHSGQGHQVNFKITQYATNSLQKFFHYKSTPQSPINCSAYTNIRPPPLQRANSEIKELVEPGRYLPPPQGCRTPLASEAKALPVTTNPLDSSFSQHEHSGSLSRGC